MTYDPDRHHRRSVRLPQYDYTRIGAYFVTICTRDRECLLGRAVGEAIMLSRYGRIVEEEWQRTETLRENVRLDAHVIMPNHIHGVVVITQDMARHVPTPDESPIRRFAWPVPRSLSAIVGSYKSAGTRRISRARGTPGTSVWQVRFHERIIRNDDELTRARLYIANNPARWMDDRENPANRHV